MPSVLVLQHEAAEGPGLLGESLRAGGLELRTVRTFAGEAVPASLGDARGLVVLGGGMGVYEQDQVPHLRDEIALLRTAVAAQLPVLGICLGSQLLAAACGAEVVRAARKEIGWYRVRLAQPAATDALLAGVDHDFVSFHWHGDVFSLPPGAVQLASSTLTPCQAFRMGARAWGFQFHPEVDAAVLHAMVNGGAAELDQAGVDGSLILAAAPRELPRQRALMSPVFDRWAALL